jgi:hypothetical protein
VDGYFPQVVATVDINADGGASGCMIESDPAVPGHNLAADLDTVGRVPVHTASTCPTGTPTAERE